jgi:hypothetical protein
LNDRGTFSARSSSLAWLDLVVRGDDRVKRGEVYRAQQQRLEPCAGDEAAIEREVAELERKSRLLLRIVDPGHEPDPPLRDVLTRLDEWGSDTALPLALDLLDRADRAECTTVEVAQALTYVESFLVRRMLRQVPTNNLNRVLNAAPRELDRSLPVAEAVRR